MCHASERSCSRAPRPSLAVLVFLLLIEPAYKGIGRLERSLPQQRAGAAELDSLLSEVKTMRSRPQVASVSAGDVRAAVDASLGRAGIKAARIVPLSDGDLQMTFSDVPYSSWAPWLAGIERELGRARDVGDRDRTRQDTRQCRRRACVAVGAQITSG